MESPSQSHKKSKSKKNKNKRKRMKMEQQRYASSFHKIGEPMEPMEEEISPGLVADAVTLGRMESPSQSHKKRGKKSKSKKNKIKRKRMKMEQQRESVTRVKWTPEDEIEILELLLKSKEEGMSVERVPSDFYELCKSRISRSVSASQIRDKIQKMRKKHKEASRSGFVKERVVELLKKVWDEASTNIGSSSGVSTLPGFFKVFKEEPAYERLTEDCKSTLEKKAAQIELEMQKLQNKSTQLMSEALASIREAAL